MLSKLLKYEFKATSRYLIPLYMILLCATLINRVILQMNEFEGVLGMVSGILIFAYIMLIIGILSVTFILMVIRFYKNLLTDEGYLMFTLPVKSHQLINSKLFVTIVWIILSIVSILASLFAVFATPERMDMVRKGIQVTFEEMRLEFDGNSTLLIIELILLCLFTLVANILLIYVSIAVGQLFTGHKLVGSFISYIAITSALQMVMLLFIFLFGMFFVDDINSLSTIPEYLLPIGIIAMIVVNILFYVITNTIFKKKLNLE